MIFIIAYKEEKGMSCFLISPCGHGSFRSRFAFRAVLAGAILLGCAFFSLACDFDNPKAAPYSRGEAIPMGDGSMRVDYVEATERFAPAGYKNLAVFLDSRDFFSLLQKEDYSVKDLKAALALLSLAVVDREGKKYRFGVPLRERDYRMAQAGESGDLETAWSAVTGQFEDKRVVVLFAVPQNSDGFTLYLKNPWPKAGQPQLAAVDLGR